MSREYKVKLRLIQINLKKILNINDLFKVDGNDWHQIINPFEDDCHLIEIQYGSKVIEDDIERLYFYEENVD